METGNDTGVLRSRIGNVEARLNVLATESSTNATDIQVFKKKTKENLKIMKTAIFLTIAALMAMGILLAV